MPVGFSTGKKKEQIMVDSVSFGPAKPVPLARAVPSKEVSAASLLHAAPSNNAQSLSLASALAQMGPPFDASKVASLKAAIANGSYQIDLGSVANGIVRFGTHDKT
jgi:flagellar biosynthesis anti-sigma factor FlgM